MEKKRITVIAVAGALILAAIVFLIIALDTYQMETPEVILPEAVQDQNGEAGSGTGQDADPSGQMIVVDRQTVHKDVAAIESPENYYMSVAVTTYWGGVGYTSESEFWHDGDQSRVRIFRADGSIRNCLYTPESVFIWYEGSNQLYTGAAGEFSAENEIMLYPYETVLEVNSGQITQANYNTYDGTDCIYVRMMEEETVTDLWIGTESGLLLCCERYVDGQVVYSMVLNELSVGAVDESAFTHP